ncbi:diadenylate cyclase CdaA [Geitlerinema sp. PCC 9228]|jgi:uncharacterized protein (TIGR00159 family)|uniref:diadenylate cyclase CdaA n=1 Tax=Geitlerinema sp. PCC 9228 TaxID=111611 RepID=UPI0009FFBC74|nr:diadenylate cyclase CdaA [Geitlerinema sp. PCC 9228]
MGYFGTLWTPYGIPNQYLLLAASIIEPSSIWEFWQQWLQHPIDLFLVFALSYLMLAIIGERRTLWMVRGFIILVFFWILCTQLQLVLMSFVLEKLVTGAAVAMAVLLQSEFRRFLEQLGQGKVLQLFQSSAPVPKVNSVIDEIVEAIKELSQNRTGALLILETGDPLDERDFSVPGVKINAEISKELLQSLFQTTTLLHDGAVLIREARIAAAGVILPISERATSRRLGTRHRAAMGITERVDNCLCVVVSEETGSISVAERGRLNRPLTSSKLRDILKERFSPSANREAVAPNLRNLRSLGLQLTARGKALGSRLLRLRSSASREKK